MIIQWGFRGFEFQAPGFGLIACMDDFEVSVGPFALTLLRDGLFLRGRQGERHWHWDDVRAWFTGAV
ncbi:hypothetical protein [Methylorubrum extorquens]|uniref:Uncharacterized protein n=1 Tax=Methylorubrum extorquens TaxID=408 RepID=A0AAX3WC41_METEX|nr:hypothetical protein [Methylorubrum extorquens]WHQ68878.1 hypothetical protein KEC54_21410 [Methylorubrum extorquens]